jgi:DHA1 family bicyclomycin/chloramphenicol resistance-like MFS transporter
LGETATPKARSLAVPHISSRRIAPTLGSLGVLAPFAIDMYLPGMPQIATDLHADEGAVQFSLMTFFAGLMIGQLFWGPLSEPLNSMMALESYVAISGTAAALMSAIQFGAGTMASLVVGLTANGTALPMV